jgi:hypothetical protein
MEGVPQQGSRDTHCLLGLRAEKKAQEKKDGAWWEAAVRTGASEDRWMVAPGCDE